MAAAASPAGCEPPPASAEPWLPPVCWEAHRNRALKPWKSRKTHNQATLADDMSGCGAAAGHLRTCIVSPSLSFPCCKHTDSSPASTLTATNPTQASQQAASILATNLTTYTHPAESILLVAAVCCLNQSTGHQARLQVFSHPHPRDAGCSSNSGCASSTADSHLGSCLLVGERPATLTAICIAGLAAPCCRPRPLRCRQYSRCTIPSLA